MEASQIIANLGPCGGCKFLRRKCHPNCIFAPHFSPDQIQKFQMMHKIFGASNMSKMLKEIHPDNREYAINSLAYEAEMRQLNPVFGCIGVVVGLYNQLNQLQADLILTKAELVKCQSLGLANHNPLSNAITAAANVSTYNSFNHQLYSSLQQQQNTGMNFIGMRTDNVVHDQFYNQNKQTLLSFDGANNYNAENVVGMNGMIGGLEEMFQYPINRHISDDLNM